MLEPTSRPLRVFLCHAKEDIGPVRDLYRWLSSKDWIYPWLDETNLIPGQNWELEIEKAVQSADAVIVCISNRSVKKEGYVQKEIRFALEVALEKPEGTVFIIPIRLDNCFVPHSIRPIQYLDFFPDDRKAWAFQRLLMSLGVRAETLGIGTLKAQSDLGQARFTTKMQFYTLEQSRQLLLSAMLELSEDSENSLVFVPKLKQHMLQKDPTFSQEDLGFVRFRDFLAEQKDIVHLTYYANMLVVSLTTNINRKKF